MLGAAIAGSLMAMLDHEIDLGAEAPFVRITPELCKNLDEIILEQAAIAGAVLLTSDLVLSRALEWERQDHRKYDRWLKALNKAERVHQRRMAAPLTDFLLPEVKQAAVQQLRPVVAKLRERFSKERALPSGKTLDEEILDAFAEEANDPDVPVLNRPHNRQLWLRFYRRDPITFLHLSPEKLWDEFTGFVTTHKRDYVRKRVWALK